MHPESIELEGFHASNVSAPPYKMESLVAIHPALESFIISQNAGLSTIDFKNPMAVYHLNKALLSYHFKVKNWDLPPNHLVPGVPIRAEYLYRMADFLTSKGIPKIRKVLDIGTGANLIYPIVGASAFSWQFVASDIDPKSVDTAQAIAKANPVLKGKVMVKLQKDRTKIFQGIVNVGDKFDFSMCNPPFHLSANEANTHALKKQKNLGYTENKLNFQGTANELWTPGGELGFLQQMIKESKTFESQISFFSTLVSKKENENPLVNLLNELQSRNITIIKMDHGNKQSRILIWSWQS